MNKRSLIFLCILSATMLVTQLFFKPSPKSAEKAPLETTLVSKASAPEPISASELPLVSLYADAEEKTLVAQGLEYNGQVLTFAWNDELPTSVYAKKKGSKDTPLEVYRKEAALSSSEPVIFAPSSSKDKMTASDYPFKGTYSIQLVELDSASKTPSLIGATLKEGKLLNTSSALSSNALALIPTPSGGYEPLGIYLQSESQLLPLTSFSQLKASLNTHPLQAPSTRASEKFYVLENDHQQLVFSTKGGALAEINLPLKSENNTSSKVYRVDFDQELADLGSKHAYFPLNTYHSADKANQTPSQGGYYPLLRRPMDTDYSPSRYYAFNLISDDANLFETPYKVTYHDQNKIVFESNQGHRKITKTFSLNSDSPYGLNLEMDIQGDRSNLWLTSGVPEVELISNMQSPILKYRQKNAQKFEVNKQKLPKDSILNASSSLDWASNSNGFFTILLDPQDSSTKDGFRVNKVKSTTLPSRIEHTSSAKKVKNSDGYEFLIPLNDQQSSIHIKAFAGPLEKSLLAQADQQNANASDYQSAQSYHGFLNIISEPCAKFLFIFLNFFHTLTHSWGFSIILLTVLLRVFLYPLNSWSIKAMRKNQEIAPEISAIQQKYKKNPKQGQIEIMSLYRKRKVNPFTGCLPMLIQMPFLIGMFSLLRSSFVLRGVPFIKGWISSLTSPDVLFSWKQALPFIGSEFHLLPILSCIMIWVQQKVTSPLPVNTENMTDQQKQQKLMSYMMLVIVTVFCYNMPSGLNLYFISSTLLGILQQWITNKLLDRQKAKPKILEKKKAQIPS